MDDRHFDSLARALSAPDTRRRLLGGLAALPVVGGLLGFLDPDAADAAGRRKRRKKRHKHGKGKGKGKGKDKRKKRCKPQPDSKTCAGKCGSVPNNCQKTVDCGPCTCEPACGACERCNGTTCEACDPCCEGACCAQAGAICHETTGACCVPESDAETCEGTCGPVTNNCGVEVACGSCACDPVCADCEVCDEDTGACVADPDQQGDPCGAAQTCAGGTVTPRGACNDAGVCVAGSPETCSPYACDGNACATSCTGDGQCAGDAVCCGGACVTGICCQNAECAPGGDTCTAHQCRCGIHEACTTQASPDCCAGACTNINTDTHNCGACGNDCAANDRCIGGQCICQPATCVSLGKTCGTWPDGCGNTLSCGGCAANSICDDGTCAACDVCLGGGCTFTTIQAAIDATPALDTIHICPGSYVENGEQNSGLFILRSVTLVGAGDGANASTNTIVSPAAEDMRVVGMMGEVDVHLKGLRITGARGISGRGVFAEAATLAFTNCTIIDNKITGLMQGEQIWGGGLYGYNISQVTLTNTHFTDNAASNGGGLYLGAGTGSTLTLDALSRITDNEAFYPGDGYAGGIYTSGITVVLPSEDNVTGNTPANCGGEGSTFTGDGAICTTT